MTVARVEDDILQNLEASVVTCDWFAGKKHERGIFPAESLVPVEAAIEQESK